METCVDLYRGPRTILRQSTGGLGGVPGEGPVAGQIRGTRRPPGTRPFQNINETTTNLFSEQTTERAEPEVYPPLQHNLKSPTTAGECVYSMPGSCSRLASSLVHHVLPYPTTRLATNLNCHSPRCVVR
jgi:hypothetical protein